MDFKRSSDKVPREQGLCRAAVLPGRGSSPPAGWWARLGFLGTGNIPAAGSKAGERWNGGPAREGWQCTWGKRESKGWRQVGIRAGPRGQVGPAVTSPHPPGACALLARPVSERAGPRHPGSHRERPPASSVTPHATLHLGRHPESRRQERQEDPGRRETTASPRGRGTALGTSWQITGVRVAGRTSVTGERERAFSRTSVQAGPGKPV